MTTSLIKYVVLIKTEHHRDWPYAGAEDKADSSGSNAAWGFTGPSQPVLPLFTLVLSFYHVVKKNTAGLAHKVETPDVKI